MNLATLEINRKSVPERKIIALLEEAFICRSNQIPMSIEPDVLLTLLYSYEMAINSASHKARR